MNTRLSLAEARTILAAARTSAEALGASVAIAVTDPGGAPIAFERSDATPPASAEVALAKARSSAAFHIPTSFLQSAVTAMPGLATVPQALCAGGGVPVMRGGECIGAVGVSGGSAEQDEEAAKAGIAALA